MNSMIKHGENTDDSDNTFDSSLSSCRVCYSGEVSGAFGEGNKYGSSLINSCKCRGSSGLYHRYCLEKWINGIEKESPLICEVCMSPYNVKIYYPNLYRYLKEKDSQGDVIALINVTGILILMNLIVFGLCYIYIPFICGRDKNEVKQMAFIYELCYQTPVAFLILLFLSLYLYYKFIMLRIISGYRHYVNLNKRYIVVDSNGHASLFGDDLRDPRLKRFVNCIKDFSFSGKNRTKLNDVEKARDQLHTNGVSMTVSKNKSNSQDMEYSRVCLQIDELV